MSDATSNDGGNGDFMSRLSAAFSNPLVQALAGMSQGFGAAAMPSRMPIPFGAAFGNAMGGFSQGIGNAYQDQLRAAQAQQAQLQTQLTQATMPAQIMRAKLQSDVLKQFLGSGGLSGLGGLGAGAGIPGAPQLPAPPALGGGPGPVGAAQGQPTAAPPQPKLTDEQSSALPTVQRDRSIAAGMQANNPGNLMFADQADASGKLPLEGNRTLAVFPDMPTGIAANVKQLWANQDTHGVNTVRGMVTRWVGDPNADLTGGAENKPGQPVKPGSYIGDTSTALGVQPDQTVDFHDPTIASRYIMAMQPHESGPSQLNPAHVQQGVQQALRGAVGQQPYQVAQQGPLTVAPTAGAAAPGAPVAAQQAPSLAMPAGVALTPQAALQQAQRLNQAAIVGELTGVPIMGDPTTLRQQAQIFMRYGLAPSQAALEEAQKAQVQMQTAGPIAGAKAEAEARAKLPYTMTALRPGSVLTNGLGQTVGYAPTVSDEVLTSGPNAGMHVQIYRDPWGNNIGQGQPSKEAQPVPDTMPFRPLQPTATPPRISMTPPGAAAPPVSGAGTGAPPGSIVTKLPPDLEERLKTAGAVPEKAFDKDTKEVNEDLADVIGSTQMTKSTLYQLRDVNAAADPGAAGELRAQVRNFVQTFAPGLAGQLDWKAEPAQIMKKLSLLGAGKQENLDQGARGGFRLLSMYLDANPGLENQPGANHDMANALLVAHQFHEDYARGATDFYNQQYDRFAYGDHKYLPVTRYDQQFLQQFRPELYKAAVDAMNGKSYDQWSKGLNNNQMQIVGGILQRADPNASIHLVDRGGQDHLMPVSTFSSTVGPSDIIQNIPGR